VSTTLCSNISAEKGEDLKSRTALRLEAHEAKILSLSAVRCSARIMSTTLCSNSSAEKGKDLKYRAALRLEVHEAKTLSLNAFLALKKSSVLYFTSANKKEEITFVASRWSEK